MAQVNQTLVELIRFTATGTDVLRQNMDLIAEGVDRARKQYSRLRDMVGSREFFLHAAELTRVNRQMELLTQRTRQQIQASDLQSGLYARQARALNALRIEQEKLNREQRRQDLIAQHGRVGGNLAYANERSGGLLFRAPQVAAGGIIASASAGFSNTVEMNRFTTELQMISRELAGAFRPAVEIATTSLKGLRGILEGLTERQQNLLALGAGTIAASAASKAITGYSLAGAAAAVTSSPSVRSIAGKVALPVAAGVGTYQNVKDVKSDPSTLRGIGRWLVRGADSIYGGETARMLGFKSGGPLGQIYDYTFGENPNRPKSSGASGQPGEHRRVLTADAGFNEAGGSFERLSNAFSIREAQNSGTDTRDVLTQIRDFLYKTFGGEEEKAVATPSQPTNPMRP